MVFVLFLFVFVVVVFWFVCFVLFCFVCLLLGFFCCLFVCFVLFCFVFRKKEAILANMKKTISRVPDQNGVSLPDIMLELHHSGREPLNIFQ